MNNIIHQSLDGTWKLAAVHHRDFIETVLPVTYDEVAGLKTSNAVILDAAVPGNFEIDLEKAGIIPDPFFGKNAVKMAEWEDRHVVYARKFNYTPIAGKTAELIFEGIDTVADIYLNGEFLGHTENMYLTHRIETGGAIKAGENEIVVHILPACLEARKNAVSAGHSHQKYNYECLRLRKAPHTFGWDIMPRLVSAGIFRSVGIYQRPAESFKQCYLMTVNCDPKNETAELELFFDTDIGDAPVSDFSIAVKGKCGDSNFSKEGRIWFSSGKLRFRINNAKLWWPKGCGKPNLYEVEVALLKKGEPVDVYKTKTGVRTVALIRTETTDAFHNGAFHFVINGRKVFILGTNWVPSDAYHSRDKARIPQMMELLDDIGCNAVRCWGGNIYEASCFYDSCDELGIMVWQDFAMACAVHPTDDDFRKIIYDETTQVIRSLRRHPSIILWAGDNECDQVIAGDGYGRNPNQNRITRETLPCAVYNEDPMRPYLPSSPFIGEEAAKLPQEYLPENHLWGPRDYYKSRFFKDSLSHFASEIGYHGMVSVKSMKRFISADKLWPWKDNDEWFIHASSPEAEKDAPFTYRIELMAKQIKELFGVIPEKLEDFVLASQISQAEAKKFFVELFRTQPHRSGLTWWNLIDGWPQFSDAVVDYYFCKKLAFYYLRQSQKPLILTFTEPRDWRINLAASNLSGSGALEFSYQVKDFASGATALSGKASCPDQGSVEIASLPYSQTDKKIYLIEWESGSYSGKNHYLAGNPPFELSFYRDFLEKEYREWLEG